MMKFAQAMFASYLEDGEEIVAVCHRHPFVIAKDMLKLTVIGVVIPVGLYLLFPEYWLFFVLWLVINLVRLFRRYLIWYHDSLLVTNVSLVDVYWHSMFNRSSTRLEYQMIEGVTQDIKGFIRTVFNYGNISIQVMSGGEAMALKDAMNPKRVERVILDNQEKYSSEQSMKDSETLKSLLISMLRQQQADKKE